MWGFQIGTFSNRPLGNVLAKLQQWLVKSIEVNCSHCWGLRNQAVEAKILGKSGWTIAHLVPRWVEPYWWSLLMHGRRLKSGLFVCLFCLCVCVLQRIDNMLFEKPKRNLWEDYWDQLGDYFKHQLPMMPLVCPWRIACRRFCLVLVASELRDWGATQNILNFYLTVISDFFFLNNSAWLVVTD